MTRTLKDIQQHTLVRIVDDNEDLRETCEMMLTYAGWQVRTYAGAWSFLMDDAPSVPGCLILDISMPDMTCLLYTSPSPRDISGSRMPSSA